MDKKMKLSEHLTSSSVAALGNSSKLDCTRLTPHFTLAELTKTKTGIENVPNEEQVENLKRLCGWLEQLRLRYNQMRNEKGEMRNGNEEMRNEVGEYPIIINSGFRSPEVNKAVGGATLSNHLTGCAVDIRCIGIEQALRYAAILLDISDLNNEDFDELLIEQKAHVIWIHFAVKPNCNRRRTNFKR
jgi:uncharacterized protein YcbK (DUF882 family)